MKSIANSTELDHLIQQKTPILLDFYANWCGPCQALLPTVEKLASEYEGKVDIRKINVDDSRELATRFGVRSIPALFFIKNEEVVEKSTGVLTESVLKEKLNQLV